MKYINPDLSEEEKSVIINKATEIPYTGKYDNFNDEGVFTCRNCSNELYSSNAKFDSGCGWPSFDEELLNKVERVIDSNSIWAEIECKNCGAHLGHVFEGEGFTEKNTRHCVNSVSLKFIPLIKK